MKPLPSFGYKQLSICLGSWLKIRFQEFPFLCKDVPKYIQTGRGTRKYKPCAERNTRHIELKLWTARCKAHCACILSSHNISPHQIFSGGGLILQPPKKLTLCCLTGQKIWRHHHAQVKPSHMYRYLWYDISIYGS